MLEYTIFAFTLFLLFIPATSPPPFIDNFNSSICQPASFQNPPINFTYKPMQRYLHNKFPMLESYQLKRYEFLDSDFSITDVSKEDEPFLRNQQTPVQIFDEYKMVIEDYQILTEQEFQITMVNPSASLIFCVKQIYIDHPGVKRIQHKKLPFCINRKTKYPFNFLMYFIEAQSKKIKFGVFFVVDLKDTFSGKFIEERVWGQQILVKATANWLKFTRTLNIKQDYKTPYHTFQLKNPTQHDVNIDIYSSTNKISYLGYDLISNKLSKLTLQSYSLVRINIEKKSGELFIRNLDNLKFENIKIIVSLDKGVFFEPINTGIIPSKKSFLETNIYISNTRDEPITVTELQLTNRMKTAQIIPLKSFDGVVPLNTSMYLIGVLRICPGTGDDQIVKNSLKITYTSNSISSKLKGSETTQISFSHYQLLNPLSNMERRFFDLTKDTKVKKRFQNSLFQLKNSLNIPLKLTNIVINEDKFKVRWVSDKRQYIYPNHPNVVFGIEYIGDQNIPLPVYSEYMTFEFNGYIMVPVQLVVYDKTLQCKYMNVSNRCTNYDRVDLGNLRSGTNNLRQFAIINSNPSQLKIFIKGIKTNNHAKIKVIGPFPSGEDYSRTLNQSQTLISTLKHKMYLLFKFEIYCDSAGYYSEIINISTQQQNFNIEFSYRLSEGKLSLHPNPLIIVNEYIPKNALISIVSTYSEQYQIQSVETNITGLKVRQIVSSQPIKPHEVKQISLVYQHKVKQNLHFENFLNMMEKARMGESTVGYVKVKTNQDLERTTHVVVTNAIIRILPQRVSGPVAMIENTNNKILVFKAGNFYNLTIKIRVALMWPEFIERPAQTKLMVKKLREKSSFYMCMSEFAKSKLKLTPMIIRSLLRLDSSPTEVFIEALQDGRFYIQQHNKQQFKTYQALEKQIGKRILASVLTGSRNCFKGEFAVYWKQLFNTQEFIRVLELGDSNTFFTFIDREYENFVKPTLDLNFDPFYKKLNITASKCFFEFCNYVPIAYSPAQETLQTAQMINISMLIKQPVQNLKPVALTVVSSIGRAEYDIIQFKSIKVLVKLESITDNNITTPISEIISQTQQNTFPLQLTPRDYKNGVFKGQRIFELKNVGDIDLNISIIMFQDMVQWHSLEGFVVEESQGFYLPQGASRNFTVKFKTTYISKKPLPIYIHTGTSFFFKINLVVLPPTGGMSYTLCSPQSLVLVILMTVVSITYIGLILRIVINEKDVKSVLPVKNLTKPQKKLMPKLNMSYIYQLREKLHPPQPEPSQQQADRQQESIIKNIQQVRSKQSIESVESEFLKEDMASIEDNRSQIASNTNQPIMSSEKQDQQIYRQVTKKQGLDSEQQSLGSGSSLSDQIFAEINNFAKNNYYKHQNSNSDKNQNQSNDSLKFYNAFLSGGPLLFRRRNSRQEFFDEDNTNLNEQPEE